nr:hypothetical protein [Tanacetum cinerariifolium]
MRIYQFAIRLILEPMGKPRYEKGKEHAPRALEERLKSMYDVPWGALPPVVIREPESGKYQPLPEVPGKGKANVIKEQVAQDLLNLQKPKRKSHADQYIFQRRTSIPTGSSKHDESSSLYAEFGLLDSEEESQEVVPGADVGDREHMDLDVADVSPQPPHEQMDKGFTAMAYPKVQENLKLTVEEHVLLEEPASSSGTLSSLQHLKKDLSMIQQDMSSIPPMTSPIIKLTSSPESPKVHQLKAIATKTTTTTTTLPPLPYQQQIIAEAKMMKRIARKKKKKSRKSPKMPPRSPPHQPPPPLLPAGPSGASRSFGAFGSSQVPPSPPPPPSTNQEDLQMDEDMAPDEQAQSSNDEDIGSAHIPKVNLRQVWWKPLEDELPATPKPAWSISSSDVPVSMNIWASALSSNYLPPLEDSLLTQTGDIATFMDYVDDSILRHNVSEPLPLGGPPGQVKIQSDFFFNKDLEYLRYGSKGSRPTLSISKMKAYYPDVGLEQMGQGVQDQQDESRLNCEVWTRKDMDRSKAFMFAIQKRLKKRRIFRNLESLVGGHVRDGDYRLLKRTK